MAHTATPRAEGSRPGGAGVDDTLAQLVERLRALADEAAEALARFRAEQEAETARILAPFDPVRLREAWAQADRGELGDWDALMRELLPPTDAKR